MPIVYRNGDMFASQAEAIVNTVNCVGVMGKGVALQFKNRWPENFKAYKAACARNEVIPGKMFVYDNGDMFNSSNFRYLINFPTKKHWRSKSKIEFIENGLSDFVSVLKYYDIKSVSLPPLGCGNGGLDWNNVRPLIESALLEESLTRNIYVFGPRSEIDIPEYEPLELSMTQPRALLFRALGDFEPYFGGSYTKVSLQKIVYFFQVLGVDFGMDFRKNIYGPYSSNLAKALIGIAKANGFINVDENDETVRVSAVAYSKAAEYIDKEQLEQTEEILDKLSKLISGFESAFGLELLSSVHYLSTTENTTDLDKIASFIHNWSERKRNLFDKRAVSNALARLKEDNILV